MNWICSTGVTALLFGVCAVLGQSASSTNLVLAMPTKPNQVITRQLKAGAPTTLALQLKAPTGLPPGKSPVPLQLKPGVYETAPYTCIVIVPPPHLDDQSIVGAGPSTLHDGLEMPTIQPNLQFIPRAQGK
jgi:hypothetical protein